MVLRELQELVESMVHQEPRVQMVLRELVVLRELQELVDRTELQEQVE